METKNNVIKISLIPSNILLVIFTVLFVMKLAGIGAPAAWSWWWITSPLWGPVVAILGIFIVFMIIYCVIAVLSR